jgi:putative ABC transport system permease protein
MNYFKLSLHLLRSDWRAGEWRVLMLALILSVGSLSTVGMFTDRVHQALVQQAASLLGADLRITSTRMFSPDYRKMAASLRVKAIENRSFPSMVSHKDQVLLCEIQAVEAGYPLRGKIELDDGTPSSSAFVARQIPVSGTVWVDKGLMRRMNLGVGQTLTIGAQQFTVAARIAKDVDQALGFASFAPRLLMNQADLGATGLLQTGSRISYRLMMAGDATHIDRLRTLLKGKLTANEKLEDVRDARPEIRVALERAEHFLGLAALTTAILSGVVIMLASRRYLARHLDGCALMRCLGAEQRVVLCLYLVQFLLAGCVAVLSGWLAGYLTQLLLVDNLVAMRSANLPSPGILPVLRAGLSGFALLLGFAFLPLLQLSRVSPLKVIRREMAAPTVNSQLVNGAAVLVLAVLFLWQAGSLTLGLTVLSGLLIGLLMVRSMVWVLLRTLARYAHLIKAQHAFNNLLRYGGGLQVAALSLGGMAWLVLTLVRGDLLTGWQGKWPVNTPNRFVVNIQENQQNALQDFFKDKKLKSPQLFPMIRARLTQINHQPVTPERYSDPRARSLLEREFNLSYADTLPAWNKLVSGPWWDKSGESALSVEEGIAKTLNIHLGDKLTYDVAGSPFTATVSNLRRVQWDSMRVNFFVIATPELLQNYPASYLASFYLPSDSITVSDDLVRAFPNLLVIDTGAVIAQVRGIIEQIAQTISVVFLYTCLAGLLVLYAAMLASGDERIMEVAILRTLGADSAYLRRLHLSEFAATGLLAGLFTAAGAALSGWLLARFVLEIPYHFNSDLLLYGVSGSVILVVTTGWLSTRSIRNMPPLSLFRGD